jgi:hypothetical protein
MKYFFVFCTLYGCATTTENIKLPEYKPDELQQPIELRKDTVLPQKVGEPVALEPGDKVPFTGILLDSYLLAKYKLISVERNTIRKQIEVERIARRDVQAYYNVVLQEALQKAKRDWLEKHSMALGVIVGTIFTSVLAIGLAYGLSTTR